jgi:hypothetical protein
MRLSSITGQQFGACCCGRGHLLTELISSEKNSPTVPLYSEIATGTCLIRSMYGPVALALYPASGARPAPAGSPARSCSWPQPTPRRWTCPCRAQRLARGRRRQIEARRAGWCWRTNTSERAGRRPCQPARPWWAEGGARVVLLLLPERCRHAVFRACCFSLQTS